MFYLLDYCAMGVSLPQASLLQSVILCYLEALVMVGCTCLSCSRRFLACFWEILLFGVYYNVTFELNLVFIYIYIIKYCNSCLTNPYFCLPCVCVHALRPCGNRSAKLSCWVSYVSSLIKPLLFTHNLFGSISEAYCEVSGGLCCLRDIYRTYIYLGL